MTAGFSLAWSPGGGASSDEGMRGMRSDLEVVSWKWRQASGGR